MTEENIVQQLKAGDKKAIAYIYDKWADPLYGVIYNICKDEAIAKDVLQDTFVKIWEKSNTYDAKKSKLFTWMYQIARNKAIDAYRKIKKSRTENIQKANLIVSSIRSDQSLYHSELAKHISLLDPKYQEVLKSLFYEGLTQLEMSKKTGIALGTIKTRLRIALRELRGIYNEPSIVVMILSVLYGG
ncbi:MAG: sigma-70 family RNA polymerase sigma factor [Saprospiraceae bacterium]|nr:sigma-70 family RNA polymerase sigma factor [Saprospiraceae bacterium]